MAFIADAVFDNGLTYLSTRGDNLYILTTNPASYAQLTTFALGTKAPTLSTAQDGASSGRRVIVATITDGSVTATGTAAYWAVARDAASELLAWQTLSSAQAVTSGNSFSLGAISITVPDPA